MDRYEEAVSAIRIDLPTDPDLRDLVRFAILAPNSHNTQPWKFRLGDNTVDILPDFSRRTPVVDPDDHHLYVTLGCAAENVLIAANASGSDAAISVLKDSSGDSFVRVTLEPGAASDIDLFKAIPERQSTKSVYDAKPLTASEINTLEHATKIPGVDFFIITEKLRLDEALNIIQRGNSDQMDDPNFVRELKSWIRFNTAASLKHGDGLSGPCAGNPNSPNWLGPILFGLMFKKKSENKKLAKQFHSSAGLAIFVAEDESPEGWITVGRCFERFALKATVMGVRHAHLNMPIEAQSVRPAFAKWLGIPTRRPDLIIRFGRAPLMPMSMRRPLDDVIMS